MKTIVKTIQLTCLVFILIITGCAPMKLIDKMPSDSPKGYAEFFCRNDKGYSDYNQKLSFVKKKGGYLFAGRICHKRKNKESYKSGYLIAQPPGYYYVSILKDIYYFHIEEGMVTPIEITLEVSISKVIQPWGLVDKTEIKEDLSPPGEPVPIEEYYKNGMK